jgi:hypothetical protein
MHNVRSPEEPVHCAFPYNGCCTMCMCVFMESVLVRFSLGICKVGVASWKLYLMHDLIQ